MPDTDVKPLNWKPEPNIGYKVTRRADGGMQYVFTALDPHTIQHWREFSLEHLLDSDRLTRNLYDLRQVKQVPKEAIQVALELGDDPSARNIRLAVVVANEVVRKAIEEIALLTSPGGVEVEIFTTVDEAETWLDRPLTLLR
jgi:hypothetical protein